MNNYTNIIMQLKEDLAKLNIKLATVTDNLNKNEQQEEELEIEIDEKKTLLKTTKNQIQEFKTKLNKDLNNSITLKTIGIFLGLGIAIVLSVNIVPHLINSIMPASVLLQTKTIISTLLTLLGGAASCYIAAISLCKIENKLKKEKQNKINNSENYQNLLAQEKELNDELNLLHTKYETNNEENELLNEEYYDCKNEISNLKGAINYIESKNVPKTNTLTKIKKLIPNHTK